MLWRFFVRSPASCDRGVSRTKADIADDALLPSTVQSDDSSHAECIFSHFVDMLCDPLFLFFSPSDNNNEHSVMLTPCPDPDLAVLYEDLPILEYVFGYGISLKVLTCFSLFISRVCKIKSFSGSSELPQTPFRQKCKGMALEAIK